MQKGLLAPKSINPLKNNLDEYWKANEGEGLTSPTQSLYYSTLRLSSSFGIYSVFIRNIFGVYSVFIHYIFGTIQFKTVV